MSLKTKAGGTRGDGNKNFHAMETKIWFCFIARKCLDVSHSQLFWYRNNFYTQKCFQKHYTKSNRFWFCIMFLETFLCEKNVSIQKFFVSPGLETFFHETFIFQPIILCSFGHVFVYFSRYMKSKKNMVSQKEDRASK